MKVTLRRKKKLYTRTYQLWFRSLSRTTLGDANKYLKRLLEWYSLPATYPKVSWIVHVFFVTFWIDTEKYNINSATYTTNWRGKLMSTPNDILLQPHILKLVLFYFTVNQFQRNDTKNERFMLAKMVTYKELKHTPKFTKIYFLPIIRCIRFYST